MSKIKEQLLREQDNLMEYYVGFYEWLERFNQEPSDNDINKMEKDLNKRPFPKSNLIISEQPLNHKFYNPKQGA